jgi:cysteine synthase
MDILGAIGNTSMVRLRKVVPPGCARIFAKLEWENPTGSVKDRMARAVITRAEEGGRLKPGETVLEYTGGSTGTSLALVCAAKGYSLRIVSSDAFSREKLDQMAALGAELTLVPSEGGLTTRKLILDMIETARGLSRESHTHWDANEVTLMADSGLKYLSTDVYGRRRDRLARSATLGRGRSRS